jgi:uncharacterized protein (TIGR03067 family)
MKTRALLVLFAGLAVAAYAPAPLPKPEKKEAPASLVGTWSVVALARAGQEKPLPGKVEMKAVLTKDRWTFTREGKQMAPYEMVVNARVKPMTLDLKRAGSPTPTIQGIYTVEGDTLKLGYYTAKGGGGRPKAFDPADAQLMVMILKRVKP